MINITLNKYLFPKNPHGYKNAEIDDKFDPLKKLQNRFYKKKLSTKSERISLFFIFLAHSVGKSSRPFNFCPLVFFATFPTESKSASNYAYIDTLTETLAIFFVFCHICMFLNFEAKAHETVGKSINSFCKFKLEFNFASIIGLRSFSSSKKG
jgi:hypothetical protein